MAAPNHRSSGQSSRLWLFLVLLSAQWTGSCTQRDEPSEASELTATASNHLVRTADPYARGWTTDDFPRITELAPGIYSYEQLRSAGEELFTTVSLFVVGPDEVMVADGQGNVEETQRLIEHIKEITDTPIRHVVIASDHGDHTGGNAAFPSDVTYYVHPTSDAALKENAQRSGDAPVASQDPVLVEDRYDLSVGPHAVHLLFLGRAHTGGDLVVHLPDAGVVFLSEAFLHRVFPAMRSAFPTEWLEMLDRAAALEANTYVPGHGFVDRPEILRQELDTARAALQQVIGEGTRLYEAGVSLENAVDLADFGALEEWSLRGSQGPVAIRRIYAELAGELPNPPGRSPAGEIPDLP